MSWNTRVRVTHLPTDIVVEASDRDFRSQVKQRDSCLSRLKGMLWARIHAPRTNKLRRTYTEASQHELDTGDCIEEDAYKRARQER